MNFANNSIWELFGIIRIPAFPHSYSYLSIYDLIYCNKDFIEPFEI